MHGKYSSPLRFHLVRAQRALLRSIIRRFSSFTPIDDPKPGYSILIGCSTPLAGMLEVNLSLLARQELTNLDQIIVAFDHPADQLPLPVEKLAREHFPLLPLRFEYYSPFQARVFATLGLPWTYSWASWMKGLMACRTKYALLHDFDAMLLRKDIIEERYRETNARNAQWCGIRAYNGNGVITDDGLVTTFEMMLDVQFIRQRFRPIDLFNQVTTHNGRTVDFDTCLYAQTLAGERFILPIAEEDLVHPSQVIHQFTELCNRRGYIPPAANNLWFIPYFLYLSGHPQSMASITSELESNSGGPVTLLSHSMNPSKLTVVHFEWVRKQVNRLEEALAGEVRPEVRRYVEAIGECAAGNGNATGR